MKKKTMGTNMAYLLMLFGFCAMIPHAVLSLLETEAIAASLSPAELESYSNFFVSQWIPFWLAFLSYLRLQKQDAFSLAPALSAAVIVLTYLPRYPSDSVAVMALTIPLILAVELSAFLKKAEFSPTPFLRGIAADRGMLRAFYFWAVVLFGTIFISCKACTWPTTVVSPFQMFPFPGILLFAVFRQQNTKPPTVWGVISMLAAVPLSLFLATLGPMEKFKEYHLMCLGVGYGIVFMMLIVYNIDQWKQ